ncbi:hypothetical protein [Chryseobacterium sp.]|uniref:hypothetical protein n=1 Tax=Chryseobacterium sp. TaxID=1871047 RepID=UPI0023F9603D|nr:hypothetical protein [Chryseobacterium sp.]
MNKINFIWGILFCVFFHHVQAQREDVNFGNFSSPVPSVSSLASYNNVPQTNATGLPDIVYPLLELPSRNKNISLGVSLSYSILNVEKDQPASDIGAGWSLFGGGVISRKINGSYDETNDNITRNDYEKNEFDDIYYYNAPGISGKFRFIRDITNNTFQLVNLSSNRDKIEYTRTSNTATLILNSFTITDAKGNKYYFNDYSRSTSDRFGEVNREFRSAFFLTKIVDAGNIEIANFTYEKYAKYQPIYPNWLQYQYCKIKSIISPGFGKIEYEYLFNDPWRMNDPYQVQKIILKDQNNHIISGYSFEYIQDEIEDGQLAGGMMQYIYKRMLNKIKKVDRNNAVSETTSFEYKPIIYLPADLSGGYPISSLCPDYKYVMTPAKETRPLLKRVINPSGGVIEYNFEYGTVFKDRTDPAYLSKVLNGTDFIDEEIQIIKSYGNTLTADTRQNISLPLTVTGTGIKKIFTVFHESDIQPALPEEEIGIGGHLGFRILQNGVEVNGYFCNANNERIKVYDLSPGNYTVQFFGINGKQGIGTLYQYELSHIPQPFPNIRSGADLRISNIKNFNTITDTSPQRTVTYQYNDFTNPVPTSSGYYFKNEMDPSQKVHVLYKNVKITDDTGGYTRYFYKNPDDYPKTPYMGGQPDDKFWPCYSITNGGLLQKKEIYNSSHQLLNSEEHQYSFEDIPESTAYPLFITFPRELSKPSWLKKHTRTFTSYFESGRSIQETAETNFNVFNFDVASTKKILDGNTIEQFYTYPETGYTNLSNAHIMNVPVLVEEKSDGKTVSKAETKYNNTGSVMPTSVVATNINDGTTKTTIKFDLYDERGNLLQFTSSVGIPTAIVYGYDKTMPIAKIEGATYAQVSPYIQAIVDASTADALNPDNEGTLLTALDNFRKTNALKDFQITTITYDPLIGMTTTTPPDGIRAIYKYDANNRLQKIVDMNGVTLKEYQYNYKN